MKGETEIVKVAFLFGTMSRGGAERMISLLAKQFVEQRDEVYIVTLDNSESGYELDRKVHQVKLNVANKSDNSLAAIKRNVRTLKALASFLKETKIDVAVSFSKRIGCYLLLACPIKRTYKVIVSERANPRFEKNGRLEKALYKYILPKVDGFIFQTESVSKLFPARLQTVGCVIPNGVFEDVLPKALPYSRHDQNKIVAVGRLTWQKGYDVLLAAFSDFIQKKKDSRHVLHIFGKGPLEDSLKKQCNELKIDGKVVFHGSVPDLPQQISDAGIFVMASRFEGMPNALMEAMACGIPCISANCEFGPAELIENGVNGLLFNVDDGQALCNSLLQLTDNVGLAERISTNALSIRESHSGIKVASMYREYIELVNARKSE